MRPKRANTTDVGTRPHIEIGDSVTYSPDHVTDAQRLTDLLDTLVQDVAELRQLLDIYDDIQDLPGRGPAADPDNTGRQATHGPSRPTEIAALDESRAHLTAGVRNGVARVTRAAALVRGSAAEMDRALGIWEGADSSGTRGSVNGRTDGAAGDRTAA